MQTWICDLPVHIQLMASLLMSCSGCRLNCDTWALLSEMAMPVHSCATCFCVTVIKHISSQQPDTSDS